MGSPDIRLDEYGSIDFRLSRQFRFYTKQDPPSQRVKPIPIQVVRAVVAAAYLATASDVGFRAVADMICIAFFFLCRPGEHTVTKDNTPFKAEDVKLYVGKRRIQWRTATEAELFAATAVSLTFTTQKNGVKGEVISHGRSGHVNTCPVRAIVRRLLYIRSTGLPDDTPLCAYKDGGKTRFVNAKSITEALRMGINLVGPDTLDIKPSEIDARSLRAGGATALFCAGVDQDTIQLLGRWKSDAMLRYLHVQAMPVMQQFAAKMFAGGSYSFQPGLFVPVY